MPGYIQENVPLAPLTTFRVGGAARYLSAPVNEAEVVETLALAKELGLPVLVLGGGSNLLVADAGVKAMVVRLSDAGEFGTIEDWDCDGDGSVLRVGAAVALPVLLAETIRRGRAGLARMAGIPGRVGGAVAMNAGAGGAAGAGGIGEFVLGALTYTAAGERRVLGAEELGFAYRQSALGGMAALSFCMYFPESGDPEELLRAAREFREKKKASQPLGVPSAGCVFKNPPNISAGALLDAAGCKGMSVGGARVSGEHANFIVTDGAATGADIAMLATLMRKKVLGHVGVRLEPEIVFWGNV